MATKLEERVRTSFVRQSMMQTLGAELLSVREGEVQIALPFAPHILQQQGFLHAGATTTLIDSACGYAALTMMPAEYDVVSVEFKINLLAPAVGERFVAIGRVVRSGRSITVCSGEMLAYTTIAGSEQAKTIALMQATMMAVTTTNT
jgi:uncharacterized protein (TIGR00369 family)